jgi:hypothetical protein
LFDHWRKTSTDHARGRAVDQPRREQPTVSIARIAGKLDLLERALDRLRDATLAATLVTASATGAVAFSSASFS